MITALELLGDLTHGFINEIRPGQLALTHAVQMALDAKEHRQVFLEGGCGLGKSFSYSIPTVLTQKRTVISTKQKTLQDQLALKDIPHLQKHLGLPRHVVNMKGRSNYVCRRLVLKAQNEAKTQGHQGLWHDLLAWLDSDPIGDVNTFPQGDRLPYPLSHCHAETCLNKRCTFNKTCGYREQRRQLKRADVVLTNHHLLGFDLKWRPGTVLGGFYPILIMDEAHAVPDCIRSAFSQTLSETWMKRFWERLGKDQIDLAHSDMAEAITVWNTFFQEIPPQDLLPPHFSPAPLVNQNCAILTQMQRDLVQCIIDRWVPHAEEDAESLSLDALLDQAQTTIDDALYYFGAGKIDRRALLERQRDHAYDNDDEERYHAYDGILACFHGPSTLVIAEDDSATLGNIERYIEDIREKETTLRLTTQPHANFFYSQKPNAPVKVITRQPLSLAPLVASRFTHFDTVICSSATLNQSILKNDLGLTPHIDVSEPSPFNFHANSMLYIPKGLPPLDYYAPTPWHKAVAREIGHLIYASQGQALVLFNSRQDLRAIYEILSAAQALKPYPLFAQGQGLSNPEIMASFLETPGANIFGLKSFFEGIDVQGDRLRLVILVRLPFQPKKEPLVAAQEQALGSTPYWDLYYFPNMLTFVRQAAGRLLRSMTDRGVFVIIDDRMWTKNYKMKIRRALPFTQSTSDKDAVKCFLNSLAPRAQCA